MKRLLVEKASDLIESRSSQTRSSKTLSLREILTGPADTIYYRVLLSGVGRPNIYNRYVEILQHIPSPNIGTETYSLLSNDTLTSFSIKSTSLFCYFCAVCCKIP